MLILMSFTSATKSQLSPSLIVFSSLFLHFRSDCPS